METRICKLCAEEKPLKKFSARIRNGKLICPNLCNICKTLVYRKGVPNPVSVDRNSIKEDQETKTCVKCGEEKPLYSFPKYKRKNGQIGRCAKCNSCKQSPTATRKCYAPYEKNGAWVKYCVNCQDTKPLSEFTKHRNSYRSCKNCHLKRVMTDYFNSTPEQRIKTKERSKRYRTSEKGRNTKKLWLKKFVEINPEYKQRRLNQNRLSNMTPEQRERRLPARKRGLQNYLARKKGASIVISFTKADIIRRDGLRCYLCEKLLTEKTATLDHLIPLSRGGNHKPENVKIACLNCNSRKNTRTITEYKKTRGDYKQYQHKLKNKQT